MQSRGYLTGNSLWGSPSKDGIGPTNVSMEVHVRNTNDNLTAFPRKVAELTASAQNDSGQPIRYAKILRASRPENEGLRLSILDQTSLGTW